MPNLITLFRIAIAPFFLLTFLYYSPEREYLRLWAFFLFLVGSLTDALDGLLARIYNKTTRLGKFLDPLADKMLLLTGYVGILCANHFPLLPPPWIVVTIVFRDLVIVGGLVVLYLSSAPTEVAPNFLGKLTTAFQMITLLSILLLLPVSSLLWYVTFILTVISGLVYVIREMRRLRKRGSS